MFTTSLGAYAGALFGLLYPTYASFKALETKETNDDTQWLTYWVAYATLATLEAVAGFVFEWIPLYYEIKLVFILWLVAPQTKGASVLYFKYIRPLLQKHASKIDPVFSGTTRVLDNNITGMALKMAEKYGPDVSLQALRLAFDQAEKLKAGLNQPAPPVSTAPSAYAQH